MSYQRDFTIGVKETQDFYIALTLARWGKGIAGFGAVGALVALLYTGGMAWPVRAALAVLGALAAAGITALVLIFSTRQKVKSRIRQSGRSSYVQSTEINGFGIHVTVGKDKAKLSFENLLRVKETRKAFYLFLSEQQAWLLPKQQMEDPEAESAQLRALFRTVIERKRLQLRK